MSRPVLGPAKSPCGSCPYRKDVPSGVWHESEYAKLPEYDKPTGDQPLGVFMCHQQDGHLCAGWVGCHDMVETLAMRLARPMNGMSEEEYERTMDYVSPVPLWESGAAAAAHGAADIEDPTVKAVRLMENLKRKQER